jgi:hypothetical protein
VFANAKRVQADRVGMFDLLDQVSQPIRWIQRATVLVERRRKTIDTYLHRCPSEQDHRFRDRPRISRYSAPTRAA